MFKKILNIILSIVVLISLSVGIAYSACPVVPFADYVIYNAESKKEIIYNNIPESDNKYPRAIKSYINFNILGKGSLWTTYEMITLNVGYNKDDSFPKKNVLQAPILYSNVADKLVVTFIYDTNLHDQSFTISNNKKCLRFYDGSYLKTSFNPTFIFYLVSASAGIALICINRKCIFEKLKRTKKVKEKDGK